MGMLSENEFKNTVKARYGIELTKENAKVWCTEHNDKRPGGNPSCTYFRGDNGWVLYCWSKGCRLHKGLPEKYLLREKPKWDANAEKVNQVIVDTAQNYQLSPKAQEYVDEWGLDGSLIYWHSNLIRDALKAGAPWEELKRLGYVTEQGRATARGRLGYVYHRPEGPIIYIKWVRPPVSEDDLWMAGRFPNNPSSEDINIQPRFIITGKGKAPQVPYLPHPNALKAERIVIFEGEKDAEIAYNYGSVEGAIGIPGIDFKAKEFVWLIPDSAKITIWLDSDSKGVEAARSLSEAFAQDRNRHVRRVDLAPGEWGNDISDHFIDSVPPGDPTTDPDVAKALKDWQGLVQETLDNASLAEPGWTSGAAKSVKFIRKNPQGNSDAKSENILDKITPLMRINGKFYLSAGKYPYYWDVQEKCLFLLDKKTPPGRLLRKYGLTTEGTTTAKVIAGLIGESEDYGSMVYPHLDGHFQDDKLYVYAHNGFMWRLSKDAKEQVPNGTDGVLFIDSDGDEIGPAEPSEAAWNDIWNIPCFDPKSRLGEDLQRRALMGFFEAMLFGRQYCSEAPILVFFAKHRTGKSAAARLPGWLRYGPKWNEIESSSKKEDFWVNVDKKGYFCWDNADTWNDWIEQAIATHATGATKPLRELYTTNDPHEVEMLSFFSITTRHPHFRRPDNADRFLILDIMPVGAGKFMDKETMRDYVHERRLGALHYCFNLIRGRLP